jgi:hypothetical protein
MATEIQLHMWVSFLDRVDRAIRRAALGTDRDRDPTRRGARQGPLAGRPTPTRSTASGSAFSCRFYDSSCERVRMLTEEALRRGTTRGGIRGVAREATARRSPHDEAITTSSRATFARDDS